MSEFSTRFRRPPRVMKHGLLTTSY